MKTQGEQQNMPARCMELKQDILGDGAFLGKDAASRYIANYLTGIKDPNGDGHNFGYLFGFDNVSAFVGMINVYNAGKDAEDQIQGVRVYLGRSLPIQTGEIIPMEKVMDNLFLMPVMADGTDFYKMAPLVDPDMILGNPRPCPNECKALSFL